MTTLGLYYDRLESTVEAQIVRDVLLLSGEFDFKVNTEVPKLKTYMEQLCIELTDEAPDTILLYKVGPTWPSVNISNVIKRDLQPTQSESKLHLTPKPGYFLREDSRVGPNLTEMYLNRRAPQGSGYVDPMLLMLWG